jgi:hypothetical protein
VLFAWLSCGFLLLLLLLLQVLYDLQPHHCAARSQGLPWILVLMIYSTSVSAGLAVVLLMLYPLFKTKAKAL